MEPRGVTWDKYALFGEAIRQANASSASEIEAWRKIVRKHIELDIYPLPDVAEVAKRLVGEFWHH